MEQNKYETQEKKVGYSGTAHPQVIDDMKAKAHDLRIPFTQLVEKIMKEYLLSEQAK